MGLRPGSQSPACLVKSHIGTEYDNVKEVADNMDDVNLVAENMDVLKYGSVSFVQEEVPTGDGLTQGARWYKPSEPTMYIYYINEGETTGSWVEDNSVGDDVSLDTIDVKGDLSLREYLTLTGNSTTTDLLTADLSSFEVGTVITTKGFYEVGDGGGAQWVKTSDTDTPSQTPGQLGDAKFTDFGGSVWELVIYENTNVKLFGAVGDGVTDDTAALDAVFAYLDKYGVVNGQSENGARGIFLTTDTPTIYVPKGQYVYDGSGYVPDISKVFVIKGESPSSSTILIKSDVHLVNPRDSSKVMAYVEFSDIKIVGGRGSFFNQKTNLGNVAHGKRVFNCVFSGYTSVAFGSIQDSDARWEVNHSVFEGGDSGTPVGLYLPKEVAEPDISGGNTFAGNKYDIICAEDGISEFVIGPSNNFFNIAGRVKEADIWLQPGDLNMGLGLRLFGNRHSNENLDVSKPNFLIADRDNTTEPHVFTHSTYISSNSLNGLTIDTNAINSSGNPLTSSGSSGFILSYTPKVSGLRFTDNSLGQWRPSIIEYVSGISGKDIEEGGAVTNLVRLTASRSSANFYFNPPLLSNLKGAGLIENDSMYCGGQSECLTSFMDGTVGLRLIHVTSNVRGFNKGGSVTSVGIDDAQGGSTAASFSFGADQIVVASTNFSNIVPGDIMWIEGDVKKSTLTPLNNVMLEVVLNGKVTSFTINLTDNWKRFRIPIVTSDESTRTGNDFIIRWAPRLFLDVGTADSFDLGRYACYNSQGPVSYNTVQL